MNRDQIAEVIGRHLAIHVSRNRMPHMSGDPRMRLPDHIRESFDLACQEAADAIMALDGWQTIGNRPPVGPILAFEDGNQYAAEWVTEPDGEGYWTAPCGQPVVRSPEPTHWKPLPPPPGDAG